MCRIDYKVEPCTKAQHVLTGKSKARVMPTQDCVAYLFYKGFSGFRTPTGNMRSVNKFLMHYRTIEAIRLSNGRIIMNNECYSLGMARCSSIYMLARSWLPITSLMRLVKNDIITLTSALENNEVKYTSMFGVHLITLRNKGAVFKRKNIWTYRYFKEYDSAEDAEKEFNRIVKIVEIMQARARLAKNASMPLSLIRESLNLVIEIVEDPDINWTEPNIRISGDVLKIYVKNPLEDKLILQDIFVDHYDIGRGNVAKLIVVVDGKIWDIALVGRDPTGQAWIAHLPFNYWLAGIDACEKWIMNIPKDAKIIAES